MPLPAGSRLGSYEVLSKLGEGGMGAVYRARDTRLGREVALKVLPDVFASDPERLTRFEREAKVLASLNHPNIAHIYGIEESSPVKALVMELVEGKTLEELTPGLGPEQALSIARQIADALEAAHEQGIVHRDLKPANVKIRDDGAVKVLDFGLAKAFDFTARSEAALPDAAASPTMLSPAKTMTGMILGTAGYMSPEQARGRPVDKRADVWAFGVVLFEMLTRTRLFDEETVTDTLAAVVTREPEWQRLPPGTPDVVRRLLARCLDRDPKRRLRDIGEARVALADTAEHQMPGSAPVARPTSGARPSARGVPVGILAATLAVALVSLGALGLVWRTRAASDTPVMRFDMNTPPGTSLRLDDQPAVAISPDGAVVAFAASDKGTRKIFVRRRDEAQAQPIAGSEDGTNPVFSPDGKTLAFLTGHELKKAALDGSSAVALEPVVGARGSAWLDNDTILIVPEPRTGLWTIPAAGGTSTALTKVDLSKNERSHRWPVALPGGKAVLYTVGSLSSPDSYDTSEIDAVVVATGERRKILEGASYARYVPDGHLVFARGGTLYAVAFDAERLHVTGAAVPVLSGLAVDPNTGAAHFGLSDNGTLVYAPGSPTANSRRLVWADRQGVTMPIDIAPAVFNDPHVSPDGSQVALLVGPLGSGDIWVYDVRRATSTRLTFDGKSATPIWSRDGRSVYYASLDAPARRTAVFKRAADGARDAEAVGSTDQRLLLGAIDRAERTIFGSVNAWIGFFDAVTLGLGPGGALSRLASTPANEYGVALSPDGRWLAYNSEESGLRQIYLRDLLDKAPRRQVSTEAGEEPRWSPDGRELYYRRNDLFMAVTFDPAGDGALGKPVVLFHGVYNLQSETGESYDVDPKTGRFLMIRLADEHASDPATVLRVVLNWSAEMRRLVAAAK